MKYSFILLLFISSCLFSQDHIPSLDDKIEGMLIGSAIGLHANHS